MNEEWVKPYPADYDQQSINTDGVVESGELNTRVMREALVEPDFRESWASGAVQAYAGVSAWAEEFIAMAGPYDDVRALQELIRILGDRIRDVRSKATNGE